MKKTISKLTKELDKYFSLFIRLRNSDEYGNVECFTCEKQGFYKTGMQCGHFQSRKHYSTRWNETNCQVQCVACNMYNQGEQFKFSVNLDNSFGLGTAKGLEVKARKTTKFMRSDYLENISYYKSLVENLIEEKQIQ